MKYLLILIIICFVNPSYCQIDTASRFKKAVAYLSENHEKIEKEWRKILQKKEKKHFFKTYKDSLIFRISKNICYHDLIAFSEITKNPENDIHIPINMYFERVILPVEYAKAYAFHLYKSDYLQCETCYDSDSLLPDKFLKVNFSKPIDNYLLAAISNADNKYTGCNSKGKVLLLLFVYDKSGNIKTTFFSWEVVG